jgi:excisionase family DNA binding protein
LRLDIDQSDIEAIAQRVLELLRPLVSGTGNKDSDDIFTMDEASEFLKTSKEQIYQWVSNARHGLGTFPYKKLGKQLRFSRKELIKWMETNKNR